MNNLYQKSLVTVDSLTKRDVDLLFEHADDMKQLVKEKGGDDRLKGKILGALFYEPSSRTFGSFIASMQRLGGGIIPLSGMLGTSVVKGETTSDTIKVFSSYSDVIVIRHAEAGMAKFVSQRALVPVINAGDGVGEHPTQALLDCYTLSKHFASFSNLRIGMIGDLKNGRTVHSLSKLLLTLGVSEFVWVSPKLLKMPNEIYEKIKSKGGEIIKTNNLLDVIDELDVIYVTRVQKERFSNIKEYDQLKHAYVITKEIMRRAKEKAVLLHPLPRAGEIKEEVDADQRALYLREQMRNGMYVRMALLDLILRKQ